MTEIADSFALARSYLAPPVGSFWRWDDGAEVLVWADGTTVAFRRELAQVLARLAPGGLPPLSQVILVLAACHNSWRDSSGCLGTVAGIWSSVESDFPNYLGEVFGLLDRVSYLPESLRSTSQAKGVLLEVVFEASRQRTLPSEAQILLRMLDEGLPAEILAPRDDGEAKKLQNLLSGLEYLRGALKKVDAGQLELRLQTGLDQLVAPAQLDLDPASQVRQLIAQWVNDEELSGLARVARQLMAAVHLPRPLADREDLPLGGVSDITNRGPLDRLLVSELAHDGLTLAVRVALGEALYLRREAPPRNPPKRRVVLLDAGVRTWGVPRVFGTAVGLALAANADRRVQTLVYRAQGKEVMPVDFTSRQGIVDHLKALESTVHPGDALPAFFEVASGQEMQAEELADAIVVTSEDTAEDAEFREALAALCVPTIYLATVNREGQFRLIVRNKRGSKAVGEAMLKLSELLSPPRRPVSPLVDANRAADLPAICLVQPFPLLLPHQLTPAGSWGGPWGVLAIKADRRLMLWNKTDRGARQLADDLPTSGVFHWRAGGTPGGVLQAVVGNLSPRGLHLLTVDLADSRCRSLRLDVRQSPVLSVCSHGSALFAIGRQEVDVLEMNTGQYIASLRLSPGLVRQHERFFSRYEGSRTQWYALCHDGQSPRLELVVDERKLSGQRLISLFDCAGYDGPVGVTNEGHLFNCADRSLRRIKHGLSGHLKVLAIAHDGSELVLGPAAYSPASTVAIARVDVRSGDVVREQRWGGVRTSYFDDLDIQHVVRTRDLRCRFSHIVVDRAKGILMLHSRRSNYWGITMDRQQDRVVLSAEACKDADLQRRVDFETTPSRPGAGYTLRVAKWPDGSRVWLDSRGLLHLQSGDRKLPELTVVLHEKELAGWCSDGRVWGPEYFHGHPMPDRSPVISAASIYQTVVRPFVERLP